jgi:hypothetical protein
LPNETFLFELIIKDERRNDFLKFTILPAVKFQILYPILQELTLNDFHYDLLDNLNNLFAFDISKISKNRWKEEPKILSLSELSAIFEDIESFEEEKHLSSVTTFYLIKIKHSESGFTFNQRKR